MEDEDKKAEVIQLKNDYESVALLKTLIKKLENDEIDSMVIMAYEQRDDVEGGTGRIYRHWFSQNKIGCLQTLGLIDYAKYVVRKFMIEGVDICGGDLPFDNLME